MNLANRSENTCLTNDCSGFNPNGPGLFRTQSVNPDSQTCYINVSNDDHLYVFVSKLINKNNQDNKSLFWDWRSKESDE